MRKIWEKIKKDCKGAVTVIVTLLLIPAVLISGTGVDLTRAYAAKSIAQDANQLAANSLLASYDAMLQDLYGLFGMMQKDENFKVMVEDYVKISLDGESWKDKGMGTFQLFYGSGITVGDPQPAAEKNLDNTQVLRRQIEEYAKYRAPVIIVEEVIKALDAFDKIKKDAKVVKQKMDIDEKVEEIDEIYEKVYNCINAVNKAGKREDSAYESVNSFICGKAGTLKDIEQTIKDMAAAREAYHLTTDENESNDWETAYNGYRSNVKALISGGTVRDGWQMGKYDDEGEYQKGYWQNEFQTQGIKSSVGKSKTDLTNYISGKKNSLEELAKLCADAEEKKSELKQMVDNLEAELNKGECSEQLRDGMTKKDPNTNKSTLETYRELLKYDLKAMANAMITHDKPQIEENIDFLATKLYYGKEALGGNFYCSLDSLYEKLSKCSIEYDMQQQLNTGEHAGDDLEMLIMVDPDTFKTAGTFKQFQDFLDTHNNDFYALLQSLYGGDQKNNKDELDDALKDLIGNIQETLKNIFLFEPEGAYVFKNTPLEEREKEEAEAKKDKENTKNDKIAVSDYTDKKKNDWGSDPGKINDAMSDNIITRISDGLEDVVDKVLLLTYDSEMFSCYATGKGAESKGEDGQKIPEINMNGIPLGIDVNYYYQSEMEYLLHGNRADAIANLKAAAGLLFLVRVVFNYVASFSIPSVQKTVLAVKGALSWAGPFAILAGELARLALVLGESALDLGRLKGGSKVALYKQGDHGVDTDNGWRFSLAGATASAIKKATIVITEESDDDRNGMGYKDYMRLFMLLIDGDVLAQRTADLIEMNVTNKKLGIGKNKERTDREAAMSAADIFRMSEAVTDFSLTTTLDLRMIFLSMPFAQKGVNGKVPPGTLQIAVTDYRGY